jgi:hypothetical protein
MDKYKSVGQEIPRFGTKNQPAFKESPEGEKRRTRTLSREWLIVGWYCVSLSDAAIAVSFDKDRKQTREEGN